MTDHFQRLGRAYSGEITDAIEQIAEPSNAPNTLGTILEYQLNTGGKRFRALLPLALLESFDKDPSAGIPFGACCELIHNATLVHDDIQDRDTHRRGAETVWRKFGEARAISLGDAGFFWAMKLIDKLDIPDNHKHLLYQRTSTHVLDLIRGQDLESVHDKQPEPPSFKRYKQIATLKTGSLFALCLSGAVRIANRSPDQIDVFEGIGRQLGILYQMQDDFLDIYKPDQKGHQRISSDLQDGTWSSVLINAAESSDRLKKQLGQAIAGSDTPDKQTLENLTERLSSEQIREDFFASFNEELTDLQRQVESIRSNDSRQCLEDVISQMLQTVISAEV